MRKITFLLAIATLALGGCSRARIPTSTQNSQTPRGSTSPDPDTAVCQCAVPVGQFGGEVDGFGVCVTNGVEDPNTHCITFKVVKEVPLACLSYYKLVLEKPHDRGDTTEGGSAILDTVGDTLFRIGYQWAAFDSDLTWIRITEWTPGHTLSILRQVGSKRVTEFYTYNGETREYFWDKGDPYFARATPGDGRQDGSVTDTLYTLGWAINALSQWEALWSPNNRINNDENGKFLALLCDDTGFVSWVCEKFPPASPGQGSVISALCHEVANCKLLKCECAPLRGSGNPICLGCLAGDRSCTILRVLGIWD